MKAAVCAVAGLALSVAAHAEVKTVKETGFEVSSTVQIKATPTKVYQAIGEIGRWWNPAHSYSHDGSQMKLELKAGSCYCETLKDGGSVQHLVVVHATPGEMVLLRGALGPLAFEGVDGTLLFTIKPAGDGVTLTEDYIVGGFTRDGMAKWAPPVDGVLGEQVARLKRYIETGSPVEPTK